jgi:guanylate kinase
MSDNHGANQRIDRIEGILETIVNVQSDMQQEQQILLRAQVVQGDELRQLAKRTEERFQMVAAALERLTVAQERLEERLTAAQERMEERLTAAQERMDARLTAAQERMDDALTALMGTVDEIIRKPPR